MASYIAVVLALLPVANGHAFLSWPQIRGHDGAEPQSYGTVPSGTVGTGMPTCGRSQFLDVQGPLTQLKKGSKVTFEVKVTAHHKGHFEFRLCDSKMTSAYSDDAAQDGCFQQHVLRRARPEEVHSDCQVNDPRGDCQPYLEDYAEYWFLPPAAYNEQSASSNWNDADATPVDGYNDHPNLLQESVNSSYSAGGRYKMTFWIPSDFTCSQCTLQFWYRTANSCTPDNEAYRCYFQNMQNVGWDVESFLGGGYYPRWQAEGWDGQVCPTAKQTNVLVRKNNCGEQFKNCADVSVGSEGSGDSSGSLTTPRRRRAPVTTPRRRSTPAAPRRRSAPQPEPNTAPSTGPLPCSGGGASGSCKNLCQAKCNSQLATNQCWGTPRYVQCKCSDGSTHSFPGCDCQNGACPPGGVSATPAPEPEPEPETATPRRRRAASEPEPEPEPETGAQPEPSTGNGDCADMQMVGAWAGNTCAAIERDLGAEYCAHKEVGRACCYCGGGSLAQMEAGVHKQRKTALRQQVLGASGSSMMAHATDRDDTDEPLPEFPEPQDEL